MKLIIFSFCFTSSNCIVFCRTMPCRPCLCWKGCIWKVSAVWEGLASLSSAPVNQHRKPSKYGVCVLCVVCAVKASPHCFAPPSCSHGNHWLNVMALFVKQWRTLMQLLSFFFFFSRSAKYSAKNNKKTRQDITRVDSEQTPLLAAWSLRPTTSALKPPVALIPAH